MEKLHTISGETQFQDNELLFGFLYRLLDCLCEYLDSRPDIFSDDTIDAFSYALSNLLIDFDKYDKSINNTN